MDFVLGGVAAMAAVVITNPLDVLKTRMQLQGELKARGQHIVHYRNIFHAAVVVTKSDGVAALQSGLIPALWTQLFLNGLRLGTYQFADSHGLLRDERGNVIFYKSAIWALVGGAAGAAACSPFFLIKTQLQSKAAEHIAVGTQHHHTGTWSALKNIFGTNGVWGLWRGVEVAIPRSSVAAAVQLTSFSYCKQWITERQIIQEPMLISLCSSMMSGVAISLAMTPIDVVSVRIYNQGIDAAGRGLLYDGIFDCFVKIWRTERLHGFYKGFVPNSLRLGPHTVLVLVFWEELKHIQHDLYEKPETQVKEKKTIIKTKKTIFSR